MSIRAFAVIIALLAIATGGLAVWMLSFTSWDDLTKRSSDIIIARCEATAEPKVVGDGMVESDIQVISVLKGNTKRGSAKMFSQYTPRQGERFLMFSTYQSNEFYRGYNATETYRIVPLGRDFVMDKLAGKKLEEQIQLVLSNRLEDLNCEMDKGADEKKRLQQGLN